MALLLHHPCNGSVDVSGGTPPFSLGSEVTYHCDDGLFPLDVRTSTCTNVGGRGEWVENPGSLNWCARRGQVRQPIPFLVFKLYFFIYAANCTVPKESSNGTIVNCERLNKTVLEGTVLTYQCDSGLSLTGPNTITCNNAGVWSTGLDTIVCVSPTEGEGN